MPATDTIVRPSLLLRSTLTKGQKTAVDSMAKTSQKPDSLGLLRPKKQKTFRLTDVHFEEEGYFKGSKYFKMSPGNRHTDGVLGTPSPYAVSNDNTVTALLLGCFVMAMIAFSVSRNFILKQIKSFFHVSRSNANVTETTYEVRFHLFLVMQTSLLLSIIYYFFTRGGERGRLDSHSQLLTIGVFFTAFIAYFMLKNIIYGIVNWVFFSRKDRGKWSKTWLFLTSLEGVLLFPLVLLQVYFSLSLQAALIYTLFVIIFIKMLSFYKCYAIFFKRSGASLQIFLYFCALEVMPALALWGVLMITDNYLIKNF